MRKSVDAELQTAIAAAAAAGEILQREFVSGSGVRSQAGRDIKIDADVLAEEAILRRLREATPHPILSEESGADALLNAEGRCWIVDPLDGTFNFSRGLPMCCVSIGLWDGNEPVLGVIYEFAAGRTYYGVVGEGAWMNGTSLQISSVQSKDAAALATGLPARRDFATDSLLGFVRNAQSYKKVRLIGSAALSLAYVASGKCDAYQEEGIYLWDVAAGLALVKAAGGVYKVHPGQTEWQRDVIATNGRLEQPIGNDSIERR